MVTNVFFVIDGEIKIVISLQVIEMRLKEVPYLLPEDVFIEKPK